MTKSTFVSGTMASNRGLTAISYSGSTGEMYASGSKKAVDSAIRKNNLLGKNRPFKMTKNAA